LQKQKRGVDILDFDMDDALNDEDNPLKVDDDDKGDGAMSQLAAFSQKVKIRKRNPNPAEDRCQSKPSSLLQE